MLTQEEYNKAIRNLFLITDPEQRLYVSQALEEFELKHNNNETIRDKKRDTLNKKEC